MANEKPTCACAAACAAACIGLSVLSWVKHWFTPQKVWHIPGQIHKWGLTGRVCVCVSLPAGARSFALATRLLSATIARRSLLSWGELKASTFGIFWDSKSFSWCFPLFNGNLMALWYPLVLNQMVQTWQWTILHKWLYFNGNIIYRRMIFTMARPSSLPIPQLRLAPGRPATKNAAGEPHHWVSPPWTTHNMTC